MKPITRRKIAAFRANRRGWVSLWLTVALLGMSLFAEVIANDRPLLVSYQDELYVPLIETYPETTFGGFLETATDYRDPFIRETIEASGWILWPPIPYSYDTVIHDLPVPAPSPPSWQNWLGTDDQARDVAARLLYGLRISLLFGLTLTLLSSIIGILAGAVQGYFGGWVDLVFQRLIEIWAGMPTLYLLIILASVVTPTFSWLLGLMLLFSWMTLVGVVRAEVLRTRQFDYVRAARSLGMGHARILQRHVLPNAMVATLAFLPFVTSGAVVTLTALDFLGFGLPPGSASLGELLRQGKDNLQAPWLGFAGFFSIATILTLLVFVGEAVRDAFDPRNGINGANDEVPAMGDAQSVPATAPDALVSIQNLEIGFPTPTGFTEAVRRISVDVGPGEVVALVGESGSGKSVTALSILGLLPPAARVGGGRIEFRGRNLLEERPDALRCVRGNEIGMIFQEPMTSLNPLHTIEKQVAEAIGIHNPGTADSIRRQARELLEAVGLESVLERGSPYPHELSGGQRQRVMIAMALANKPDLLIADEPTTAVDVTIQAQLLELLASLRARYGMAMLFITHDLSVVRKIADRVCVMNAGRIVETGPTSEVLHTPEHPYTRHLLAAEPSGEPDPTQIRSPEVLGVRNLKVWYPIRTGLLRRTTDHVKAVDGVTLDVREGETLGVVGESGSGKSTLGLAILGLVASQGERRFLDHDLASSTAEETRTFRRQAQIVFQDPYGSLSPRLSVGEIVGEGLLVHPAGIDETGRRARIAAALQEVDLPADAADRYPHEFSGGQRQRIAIARAMILRPRLIILDEPTSALDVSVQAQITELLKNLQRQHGTSYVFISHDLRVVRSLAHRVAVMKAGHVVEQAPTGDLFASPQQAYTQELIRASLL